MQKIHAMVHRLHNPDLGILFVRLALGIVFVHAGWLKVTGLDGVVGFFGAVGIPAFLAYFVAYAELIGGVLILVGFLSRYAGLVLAAIMLVATLTVHLPNGYGLANNGFEYTLTLMLLALAVVTFGSGRYSLAGLLRR